MLRFYLSDVDDRAYLRCLGYSKRQWEAVNIRLSTIMG